MTTSTHSHKNWIAHTDGACRGNPGPSSAGVFIVDPEGTEHRYKKTFGTKTNNQAEYLALILALEHLVQFNAQDVIIRADSELMIKQIRGEYKVKNEDIKILFGKAKDLILRIPRIRFEHVRREANKEADRLANLALDEYID